MRPTMFTMTTLIALIVVALIGGLDAARSDQDDLVVVFGAVLALAGLLLARTVLARPVIAVRPDLARWLSHRASITGERPGDLADRAVAAYRDGLVGREDTTVAGSRE